MKPGHYRIATRRSPLAIAQATWVADRLAGIVGVMPTLVPVVTLGDTAPGPLASLGGTGVFATAVRQAVIDGQAELAVHSLKDLPTREEPGLALAAVPVRSNPHDVMIGAVGRISPDISSPGLGLAVGAKVGTGSPRRAAQLRRARPDVEVVDIRGNIATRLGRVQSGELDAVILAQAGIDRLGLDVATIGCAAYPLVDFVPAAGQGALAIETTAAALGGPEFAAAMTALDDPVSRAAITAERAVLAALEAGCSTPIGAYAHAISGSGAAPADVPGTQELELTSTVTAIDGTQEIRMSATGPMSAPTQLGSRLASELLSAGAASLLGESLH